MAARHQGNTECPDGCYPQHRERLIKFRHQTEKDKPLRHGSVFRKMEKHDGRRGRIAADAFNDLIATAGNAPNPTQHHLHHGG